MRKIKIMHVCLASHYTEGMTYQDNQLAEQNARDGHSVVVVSDCYTFNGSQLVEVPEEDRILDSGIRLIRCKYDKIINNVISSKIRKVSKLLNLIKEFSPEVILFHGAAGWEMLTVAKYRKNFPSCQLYIDSHEDFHNSGTFWLSKFFQYKIFNKIIVNRIKKYVNKFLYISEESKIFLKEMYSLSDDILEFFPLGGTVFDEDIKDKNNKTIRNKHHLSSDDILIVHSGKLDAGKKTEMLLKSLFSVENERLKIFIIGSIPDDMRPVLMPLIERDHRVFFIGWKSGAELVQYLCAADLYFQPGTQSATMQNAICCGAPVALFPYASHKPYINGNGFYVENEADCINALNKILTQPKLVKEMKNNSIELAKNLLDYKKLAEKLYW